jgi:hypothetical protein
MKQPQLSKINSDKVSYTIPVPLPETSREDLRAILHELVERGARAGGKSLVLSPSADRYAQHLEVLRVLESLSMVVCSQRSGPISQWQLTRVGQAAIKPVLEASGPTLVLKPRPGISLNDMSAFEIMCLLDEVGWQLSIELCGAMRLLGDQSRGRLTMLRVCLRSGGHVICRHRLPTSIACSLQMRGG